MVEYKCNRCKKVFKQKSHYECHISRKFLCKSDQQQENNNVQNAAAGQQNAAAGQQNAVVGRQEEQIDPKQCQYCKSIFTRISSLKMHLKNRCKVKKQRDQEKEDLMAQLIKDREDQKKIIDEQNKKIEEIRKEMESIKKENSRAKGNIQNANSIQNAEKIQNNTQNTQNNNTINQQINIIAYGKEDLSHIQEGDYKRILNKGFKSIQEFVNSIHFNNNKPENHNVYISNLRDNYILVYDGNSWQVQERDNILQDIVDNKGEMLQLKFNEIVEKLDEPTVRKFRRFLDERDEKEVISSIKKDLKLLLYNKRKIVEGDKSIECNKNG
jgi:hypothetical protein